ncbi:MAG: mechanosensitive ion channel [Desulfarculaceae bacterium]|jgi:small conductance mechanosensitive channel
MESINSEISQYVEQIRMFGDTLGPIIIKALVLLVLVLFLVKFLGRFFAALLIRLGMPERRATMATTTLHILVLLVAALLVLNIIGFPGILLFRIMMIIVMVSLAVYIILKPYIPRLPFKKGDTIKFGGIFGKADTITFMHTLVRTFDGKIVFIPNHKILNDQVVNLAMRPNRRLDIDFFIPYGKGREQAKKAVMDILSNDERVLEKPAPRVVVSKLEPEYIVMQARFWVPKKYALTGRWGINELIIERFEEEGIQMAGPRLEVSQAG